MAQTRPAPRFRPRNQSGAPGIPFHVPELGQGASAAGVARSGCGAGGGPIQTSGQLSPLPRMVREPSKADGSRFFSVTNLLLSP
jgi:hypothetical protein